MENFEFQKYRDSLAKEIRREPDMTKKREILTAGRLTKEYQEARRLKQNEPVIKQENKVQDERLIKYAQEHYRKYTYFDPETTEILNTVKANEEKFKKEILPNAPDELINQVIHFIDGNKDQQIISYLKRANFDYENMLASEKDEPTKAQVILEIILKMQSYNEAVEQNQDKEIDFSGFENDPDIPDAKEFIYRSFGAGLLQKCLISKVKYSPDIVNIQLDGIDYKLPVDVYAEWEKQMPEVKSRKFRAESFVLWNADHDFSKKFIPTPIHFFSFYSEEPEKLDYLSDITTEKKMRQYKLGAIAHEVAHHIYDYLFDSDKRKDWRNLVDSSSAITDYAKSYSRDELKYDEFFAEAIRIKTTNPDYLKVNFPNIDKFLTTNFPNIKA